MLVHRVAPRPCRAHKAVEGWGKALNATAWQRLVEAAGGDKDVGPRLANLPL
ncbi:hypothetical protein [Streptomyces sp. AS02]|uniref:hypothetical protein n=1 Tax=Streptomyces sp. AS02 TaxID=2938946 RepID=UPI00201FDE17|nr:hypothetical protein [Streptomyces sp. AS02]MCL8017846.1 hypothetical protein [Streptomyces sp. AS02]